MMIHAYRIIKIIVGLSLVTLLEQVTILVYS